MISDCPFNVVSYQEIAVIYHHNHVNKVFLIPFCFIFR